MRIVFQSEGGAAAFPGLARPETFDTERLDSSNAERLEQLVLGAAFFEQPSQVGVPSPGAADYRTYTITVADGGKSHTVRVIEPIRDEPLQALVEHLRGLWRTGKSA